jgi:Histidine kinase-, DNA gyrase B-, and HSP90-like ATPase
MAPADDVEQITSDTTVDGSVSVQIGPSFLQLFSEQMYTSPNKAFEELVSNSWDASATAAYVFLSQDLHAEGSAAWVLDNGESMDLEGFRMLWAVATSTKPERTDGRLQIGKFGIGKLATYVLAHKLTYVCQAADGLVRAVTMNYRRIDDYGDGLHIEPLPLAVHLLNDEALARVLASFEGGDRVAALLAEGVPVPAGAEQSENEFGGEELPTTAPTGTWTLALLTDLREQGSAMQTGRIRRMLRAALPLGSSMQIAFNGETLAPTKLDVPILKQWTIGGPDLGIDSVTLPEDEETTFAVSVHNTEHPYVEIDGVSERITGTVTLFGERISAGKSEDRGASNGFFVNILGRVVNLNDPYFGLENLNHSSWSRFRATVRTDGLNQELSVNREDLREATELRIFRSFLRAVFNKARTYYDSEQESSWPDAGDVLVDAWGVLPVAPLKRLIARAVKDENALPGNVDISGVEDLAASVEALDESDSEVIEEVKFFDGPPNAPLVTYDLAMRAIRINSNHPFSIEHGATHEEQLLLRDAALVDFLVTTYLADLGVPLDTLEEASVFKDQMLRLVARLARRAPQNLVELLREVTHLAKPLEVVVGDALEHLGFVVKRLGTGGEPEGIAIAPATKPLEDESPSYSFTYDAKSTAHARVANNDVKVSTLVRHRKDHHADYTLVVAPDYESGALEAECTAHGVTPMKVQDLGRLLLLNASYGPLEAEVFRQIFERHTPSDVTAFVDDLTEALKDAPRLDYGALLEALAGIGYREPDVLTTSVIAREMRKRSGNDSYPTNESVQTIIRGLSVLLPQLVRATGERVYLGAQPIRIREALLQTIQSLPPEYQVDF